MVDNALHLVYNSDNNYLMPTFVSAASALYFATDRRRIVIDVLDCGITDAGWDEWSSRLRARFPACGGIVRHLVDCSRIAGFESWRGSVATYARILTPELLDNIDKCLFVDGDTLFLADPIELDTLYDPSYWIQGSVDLRDDGSRADAYAKNGLLVPRCYVCCGLMLMNLSLLREHDFTRRCLDFVHRFGNLKSADQEAINSICAGHVQELPCCWGVFNDQAFSKVKHPRCLHFVAGKPWVLDSITWTHCLFDFERLWFSYAKRLMGIDWYGLPGVSPHAYYKRIVTTAILKLFRFVRGTAADKKWIATYFIERP